MALVKRRVANPAPAVLTLVNPGRKSMAARKRRASTTRRRKARASNPKRRRSSVTVRARRSAASFTRRKRRNPMFAKRRRRSVSRRRNPVSGALREALPLVGSGIAIGFALPIVNRFVGGFLPFGQFNAPVVTIGTGYGLGWLVSKIGFLSRYRGSLETAGLVLGITQIVTPLLGRFMAPAQAPQGMNGVRGRRGLNGIAAVPSLPPQIQAPRPQAQGMRGIASYQAPGRFGR